MIIEQSDINKMIIAQTQSDNLRKFIIKNESSVNNKSPGVTNHL